MINALVFFGSVYGFMAGMVFYAWATTPKNSDNTGMRL